MKGLIIFIIIFAVIMLLVAGFLTYYNTDKFIKLKQQKELEVKNYSIQIKVVDSLSGESISGSIYVFKTVGQEYVGIVGEGLEIFNEVRMNNSYWLSSSQSGYYTDSIQCLWNQSECVLRLDKKAMVGLYANELNSSMYQLVLDVSDGVVRNLWFCAKANNLLFFEPVINLSDYTGGGRELRWYWDKCYTLHDLNGTVSLNFLVVEENKNASLSFLVGGDFLNAIPELTVST